MHTLRLNSLRFSNLLSYGNTVNEVKFEDGMTWICGSNGTGKSGIIEALNFAFFNCPYRGINKPALKNTANKGKMFVEADFNRIDNKSDDNYVITRHMDSKGSTTTNISKNGEPPSKKEAGISQKKLEDEILGFNKIIFDNIISLNTIKTLPFIDMEPKDKRKLIESILTLCIDKWKETNATALKEANTKFNSATSDVIKYQKDLTEFDAIIVQMEQERIDNIKELEIELGQLEDELKRNNDNLTTINYELNLVISQGKQTKLELDVLGDVDSNIAKYQDAKNIIAQLSVDNTKLVDANGIFKNASEELDKLRENMLQVDGDVLKKQYQSLTSNITSNEKKLSSLQTECSLIEKAMQDITNHAKCVVSGVECQTCGKPSTEEDVTKLKNAYRDEWKTKKAKTVDINKEIEVIQSSLISMRDEQNVITSKLNVYETSVNLYNAYNSSTYSPAKRDVQNLEASINTKQSTLSKLGESDVSKIESILIKLSDDKQSKIKIEESLATLRVNMSSTREKKIAVDNIIESLNGRKSILIDKIDSKSKIDLNDALTSTKKKREGVISDYSTAKTRVIKYSDEISLTTYINKMCSDNGIKKIVLGIFIPNLNRAIEENIKIFGLPFTVVFDDSMNYVFSSRFGMAEVYEGLSEGQKRKLNFAIAMAFRDFVTAIADFKMNTLFLDEVLDISTDAEALYDMMSLLKNKTKDIGGVYLITHRGNEVSEFFDNKIEVTNDGRYSSLKMTKLRSTNTN